MNNKINIIKQLLLFSRFVLLCIVSMSLCLISCGGDEDDTNTPESGENGIVNEFGSARFLIGAWVCNNSRKPDWMFKADGTCEMYASSGAIQKGVWSYDPETKYLATTCYSWAWTVHILTASEWQGTMGDGDSYSYFRYEEYIDDNVKLIYGKWVEGDKTLILNGNRYTFRTSNESLRGTVKIDFPSKKITFDEDCELTIRGLSGSILYIYPTKTLSDKYKNLAGKYTYSE